MMWHIASVVEEGNYLMFRKVNYMATSAVMPYLSKKVDAMRETVSMISTIRKTFDAIPPAE